MLDAYILFFSGAIHHRDSLCNGMGVAHKFNGNGSGFRYTSLEARWLILNDR